jgi:branched-subunit amino acid transport protein
MIFSGETKETQTNFCCAMGLSSSNKSTYCGFSDIQPITRIYLSFIPDIFFFYPKSMFDLGELIKRAIKYLVEGLMVAIAAYAIPKGKGLSLDEVALIALTAAATFSILDTYIPSMGVTARTGAGFGIGANMVGFPR